MEAFLDFADDDAVPNVTLPWSEHMWISTENTKTKSE